MPNPKIQTKSFEGRDMLRIIKEANDWQAQLPTNVLVKHKYVRVTTEHDAVLGINAPLECSISINFHYTEVLDVIA